MRISMMLIILLSVGVSAVTFAGENTINSAPFGVATWTSAFMCADGCNGAPVVINPKDGFSLDLAKNLFHRGVEPQLWQLVGNWKMAGMALVPNEPDWTFESGYDPNGLKNSDGSFLSALRIASGANTGEKDFAGKPIVTAPSVVVLGLGSKKFNQGPNEISFNNEDRSACFAQFDYSSYDYSEMKSYMNFECRLLASDIKKMVCKTTLHIDPSEESEIMRSFIPWNGRVLAYRAYVKE